MSVLRIITWALLGLLVAVATALWAAPASLGDWALDKATAGRARLADTSGTLWQGQGRLVLVNLAEPASDRAVLNGLVLPGRLSWQLSRLPILLGVIDASVTLDGISAPLKLTGGFNEIRGSSATLDLPSVDLARLGSPWNTIRPSAAVGLNWNDFAIRRGTFEGRLSIELREASSAMTSVRPLGTYKIDVDSKPAGATDVVLRTLRGPLTLNGSGVWDKRSGLRFSATAEADARERERLQGFLVLIGRREGDKVVFKIGA